MEDRVSCEFKKSFGVDYKTLIKGRHKRIIHTFRNINHGQVHSISFNFTATLLAIISRVAQLIGKQKPKNKRVEIGFNPESDTPTAPKPVVCKELTGRNL